MAMSSSSDVLSTTKNNRAMAAALTSMRICPSPFSPRHGRSPLSSGPRVKVNNLVKVTRIHAARDGKTEVKDEDEEFFNPLEFVTDNASSRGAIQLTSNPAQDGNVGQMLYRTEDKGKEFGSYVDVGEFKWFVRETGSLGATCGKIMFLHGAPTQSYSYRVVMSQMADSGYHCYAPDWLGFGFSEKPQPEYDFSYTEAAYHEEIDKLLIALSIDEPFCLVTQGFLLGSYGLTWCLKNPDRITKLGILNSPLTTSSPLPGLFRQLRFPFIGEFVCQNAIMAERFIEGGSPYVLKNEKADVYRLPFLQSSGPGFALLEAARKVSFQDLYSRIADGFSSGRWNVPTLVSWGISDKYLSPTEAETFQKNNSDFVTLNLLEGAGHMPQEDWPEKVIDSLRRFLR